MKNNLPGFKEDQKALLVRKLMHLEKLRRGSKSLITFILVVTFGAVIWIWYISLVKGLITEESYIIPLGGTVLIIVSAYGLVNAVNAVVNRAFKTKVIKNLLVYLLPNVTYNPYRSMTINNIVRSNLFKKRPNTLTGEDFFSGKRGVTEFKFSEVNSRRKRTSKDSEGNDRIVYDHVFNGVFVSCGLKVPLDKAVKIIPRSAGSFYMPNDMNGYVTNDAFFDKTFMLFGYNEKDANKIIESSIFLGLKTIQELFKCSIFLSFIEENINVGIKIGQNFFDPNLKKDIDIQQVEKIYSEIVNCLMVVDVMDEFNQGGERTYYQDQIEG